MTYEIRKSTTKMLEWLGPAGEHIWRSKLQGCWDMMHLEGRGGASGCMGGDLGGSGPTSSKSP